MTTSKDISGPITRREAIRGAVIFSTGAWAAGHMPGLRADAPQVDFSDDGLHVLALGDYGMKGNADQRAVADRMASFSRSLGAPLAAVLAIGDNFFLPAQISFPVGTQIAWVNNGGVQHTVTAPGIWDSGTIAPGGRWAAIFAIPGEFGYECTIHPEMRGNVTITAW